MDIPAIIEYIKSLPVEEITLEKVVEKFHYHPAYLSRKFTQETGVSFRKYVESLKIQRGKQKLLEDSASVTEISGESGYEFSNNFSASFKKHTGITPRSYLDSSSRAYRFMRRFLDKRGAVVHHSHKGSTNNYLTIDLIYPPEHEGGIHFVGIFPDALPNQTPVVGVATTVPSGITLSNIPNGAYYLLACELDPHITFFSAFLMEDNYRGRGERVYQFGGDDHYQVELEMRPPQPEDPAITFNLLKLLMDLMEKR